MDRVILVIQGILFPRIPRRVTLETIVARLRQVPGVSGVVHLELHDPIFLGEGGGTFVLIGLSLTKGPVESRSFLSFTSGQSLANELRGCYPAVKLELTGELPLNFDIRKASADDVRRAETLVIPATLALLLLAFGSFVAALAVGSACHRDHPWIAGFLPRAGTYPFWFNWPPCLD